MTCETEGSAKLTLSSGTERWNEGRQGLRYGVARMVEKATPPGGHAFISC